MTQKVYARPLWFAIVATVVGLPTHVLSLRVIRRNWLPDAAWFGPVPLTAPGGGGVWTIGPESMTLFDQLVYTLYAFAANAGLAVGITGTTAMILGFVIFKRKYVVPSIRLIGPAVAAAAAVIFVATDPTLGFYAAELVRFLLVAVTVFLLAGGGLLALERRVEGRLRILVLGPLATATVFLSLVMGGLASQTLARPLAVFTLEIVQFALGLLSVGGVNQLLTAAFELDNGGIILFWIGVNAVLGWTLAALVVVFELEVIVRLRAYWTRLVGRP